MSKKLFLLPALVLGAFLLFTPSCGESDPCKDVNCGNGICDNGDCLCNAGYEGLSCEAEWSTKFVATYPNSEDVCNTGTFTYSLKVSRVSESKVLLEDLGGTVYDVEADIELITAAATTAEKISFNYTTGGRTFVGTGTISGTKVTGTYTISQGGTITDDCNFTWDR